MGYALDAPHANVFNILHTQPYPDYPFGDDGRSILSRLIPVWFHDWSLQLAVPVTFGLVYYTVAHSANHFQSGYDYTKAPNRIAKALSAFVILHNAGLCLYSLFTFLAMAPVVFDLLIQGLRAAGHDGAALAFCSIPTNNSLLGRWTYLFYLSKYYEVMDSVILYLKGKKIGNLQSYHHAGALLSMWIAYRFHAQPVWVFVTFNSGVHTLMYAYYLSAALKLPFPRALKRNLTTLQILQIASGTVTVNLYYIHNQLDPARVLQGLKARGITTQLPVSLFGSQGHDAQAFIGAGRRSLFGAAAASTASNAEALMDLATYAQKRLRYPADVRSVCIETTGTAVAILGNTLYMAPLLVLFANFYISSYLKQQHGRAKDAKANGVHHANGNGHSNGHAKVASK